MTKKEAKEVFINRGFVNGIFDGDKWRESVAVISKWLEQEPCCNCIEFKRYAKEMGFEIEQEPILDKVRAEIEKETDRDDHADEYCDGYYDGMRNALAIIDKYKAESEKKDA